MICAGDAGACRGGACLHLCAKVRALPVSGVSPALCRAASAAGLLPTLINGISRWQDLETLAHVGQLQGRHYEKGVMFCLQNYRYRQPTF